MKIAAFGDVHGNIFALEAVLKEIKTQHPDKTVCTGDLVGYTPFPNEVVAVLHREDIETVMGNYDDGIGNARLICGCDFKTLEDQVLGEQSIMWTLAHTTEETKEFLRHLPQTIQFTAGKHRVAVFHGSPRQLNEYLHRDASDDLLREIGQMTEADLLIFGHTHIPYHRRVDGKHFINTGSVGKPKHGDPKAVYALITVGTEIEVDFAKVPYPVKQIVEAIKASDLPDEFAQKIELGIG